MTASEKPWTPDLPLRADASDADMSNRARYVAFAPDGPRIPVFKVADFVARELASAVSEEKDAKYREDTSALTAALRETLRVVAEKDAEIARLTAQLAAYEQNHGWVSAEVFAAVRKNNEQKEAEIARLRIDAERWRTVRPWFSIEENDGGDIQLFCEPELLLSLNERCAPEGELLPQAEWPTVEEIVDEIYPPADSAKEAK